jgi:hypothetical protein
MDSGFQAMTGGVTKCAVLHKMGRTASAPEGQSHPEGSISMTVRTFVLCTAAFALLLPWAAGDETPPPAPKVDYTALSSMIHKVVLGQLPPVIRTEANWGNTIPIEEGLRLMKRRKTVPVGDHREFPHGQWRKTRAWFDNPDKDLIIKVLDLKPAGTKGYQITLDVNASVHAETEIQQWQKGILLADILALTDVGVDVPLQCDVTLALGKGFPPEVKVEPKVTSLKTNLEDFKLKKVELRRPGLALALEGKAAEDMGKRVQGALQELLHNAEPTIAAKANEAIARSLREGKGNFSATALLNALSAKSKAQAETKKSPDSKSPK